MSEVISIIILVLKSWWWLFLPAILYLPVRFLYFWWVKWEVWYKRIDWMTLEIVPPGEIEKPFRAMEDVFSALWPIYDFANWRERWCEGELPMGPYWFSFEIASFEGDVHFYLRIERGRRSFAESIIYTHYPEAEIFEVEDYTQTLPQDLPNKVYDVYGEDFKFIRDHSYPIKTYKFFEARIPEAVETEKRIDPLYSLMEAMTNLRKGEITWFQIVPVPITNEDIPWASKGKQIANKIARRPQKPKSRSILQEISDVIIGGQPAEAEREKGLPPGVSEETEREMLITPGERAVLTGIEEKISKYGFATFIRFLYIFPRGAYYVPHGKIGRSYFAHFFTQDMNTIVFSGRTRSKVHYLLRKRRVYARKKSLFEKYVRRFPPSFPKMVGPETLILNIEELATLFHLPTKASILPPGVPRVPVKKGAPPPGIPTE